MFFGENDFVFCHTVSKNNHTIVSTGITINNYHIEGFISSSFYCTFQNIGSDSAVSSNEGKHGCHIRMNHACTFSNACNLHNLTINFSFISCFFNEGIGSLDCHRTAFAFSFIHCIYCISNTNHQFIHRQEMTNYTSGTNKGVFRFNTKHFCTMSLHLLCIFQTLCTSASICTTTINQNSLSIRLFIYFTANQYRRSTHFVLCKYCTARSRNSTVNNCYIVITACFNASFNASS